MNKKVMAIVGSRKMSLYGRSIIERVVGELIKKEYKIVTLNTAGCNGWVKKMGGNRVEMVTIDKFGFEKAHEILAQKAEELLVVEGGEGSGTITAAWVFMEKGKKVWAIPGRLGDKGSAATNFLIKNGAEMVDNLEFWPMV